MTIHLYLKSLSLDPDEIQFEAYDITLKALGLTSRDDPITEVVAKKIVEVSRTGVRDPVQLSRLEMEKFGTRWWRPWRKRIGRH